MACFSRAHVNRVTRRAIGAAITVHRHLGPGLFESTYHSCICFDLAAEGIPFRSKVTLPLTYRGHQLEAAYQIDLIVEDLVIVELKAQKDLAPIHDAQLLTYMKLTGAPAGLLINFHVPLLRDGVRRLLNPQHEVVDDFAPGGREKLATAAKAATRLPT
jgi:GxxExxY protein